MAKAYSGAEIQVMWGEEVDFNTAVTADKVFGPAMEIDTISITNNCEAAYGVGSRVASAIKRGTMEGAISLSFDLTTADHDWLALVWPDDEEDNEYAEGNDVESVTIMETYDGISRTYAGCVPTSFSLEASTDAAARVSLDFVFASHTEGTEAALEPTYTGVPFRFADAEIELGSQKLLCFLQSISFSAELGNGLRYGAGDDEACGYGVGQYEYSMSAEYIANDDYESIGLADAATKENGHIEFSDGDTTIKFDLTDVAYESVSISVPGVDDRSESLEMMPRSVKVEITLPE